MASQGQEGAPAATAVEPRSALRAEESRQVRRSRTSAWRMADAAIRWERMQAGRSPGYAPAHRATKAVRAYLAESVRAGEWTQAVEDATRARLERRSALCGVGGMYLEGRSGSGVPIAACQSLPCRIRGCPKCHVYASRRLATRCDPEPESGGWTGMLTLTLPRSNLTRADAWERIGAWAGRMAKYMLRFWNSKKMKSRDARDRDAGYVWVVEAHKDGWPHVHMLLSIGEWKWMELDEFSSYAEWIRQTWGKITGTWGVTSAFECLEGVWQKVKRVVGVEPNCRWDVARTDHVRQGDYARKYLLKPPSGEWLDIAVWSYRKRRLGASRKAPVRCRSWDRVVMVSADTMTALPSEMAREGWRVVHEHGHGTRWERPTDVARMVEALRERGEDTSVAEWYQVADRVWDRR